MDARTPPTGDGSQAGGFPLWESKCILVAYFLDLIVVQLHTGWVGQGTLRSCPFVLRRTCCQLAGKSTPVASCQFCNVGAGGHEHRGFARCIGSEDWQSIQNRSLASGAKSNGRNTLRSSLQSIQNTVVAVQSNSFEQNTLQFRLCKLLWGKTLFFLFFIFSMRDLVGVPICEYIKTGEKRCGSPTLLRQLRAREAGHAR